MRTPSTPIGEWRDTTETQESSNPPWAKPISHLMTASRVQDRGKKTTHMGRRGCWHKRRQSEGVDGPAKEGCGGHCTEDVKHSKRKGQLLRCYFWYLHSWRRYLTLCAHTVLPIRHEVNGISKSVGFAKQTSLWSPLLYSTSLEPRDSQHFLVHGSVNKAMLRESQGRFLIEKLTLNFGHSIAL